MPVRLASAKAHHASNRMNLPIKLISTDFDGTFFAEFENPPVPEELQRLIAENNSDADAILDYLNAYCARVPGLTVVRNDVYARFSHGAYSKGTALSEIARRLEISPESVLAAGDHLNDLPMLARERARWLVAPSNAVELVKQAVRRQEGFVSDEPHGYGVARGLEFFLESTGWHATNLNSKT